MRSRWIGLAGLGLLFTALTLTVIGPRFFARAYWGTTATGMMSGGMMAGMMNGGMPSGGMMAGMMGGQAEVDPNQPFDQRFLDQMIMHHQQGVMMTQHMVAESDRPELRDLAERIITAQQREIEQLRQWRSDWYAGAAGAPEETMLNQLASSAMSRDQMRGMMGTAVDFDRMFLTMMIPHHQDAITMAEQARTAAQHPEIGTLAETIVTTQRAEIEEMQRYLHAWYGTTN